MKILIDTSYLLPLIKIKIENVTPNLLIKLLSEHENKYYYSDLSIFELAAKRLKYSSKREKITPQDIRIGIDTLQNEPRLEKMLYTDNPFIIELASSLRAIHKDTIDCLIFATAICECDCIMTMDSSFFEAIDENPEVKKEIFEINDSFKFWFDDISRNFLRLS